MYKKLPIAYKISFILLVIWMIMGMLTYFTHKWIIFPAFNEIEQEEAKKNGQRAVNSIDREIDFLKKLCQDWAFWDDTYDFASSYDTDYIKSNINFKTFESNELSLLYVVDGRGKVIWGQCYDPVKKTYVKIKEIPSNFFPKNHPMRIGSNSSQPLNEQGISGIFNTGQGFMLFSSQPILTSDHLGPSPGMVIMGRTMGPAWLNRLNQQTRLDIELVSLDDKTYSKGAAQEEDARAIEHLTEKSTFYIHEQKDSVLEIYTPLYDIQKNKILILKITLKGKVLEKGRQTLTFALCASVIAIVIILLLIFFMISTSIVSPIATLSEHINSILKTGDLSSRIKVEKHDEIGALGDHYNKMLDQLEKKNSELNDLAITDPLTGLFNRRHALDSLNQNLAVAQRYSHDLGIILWDIDHFKNVNDTYGHNIGDEVLVRVSNTILSTLRTADIVARFGGEEFLTILPNQDEKGTRLAANRVRSMVEDLSWEHEGLKVTISGGICTDKTLTAAKMIAQADKNLYGAKDQGRNRIL